MNSWRPRIAIGDRFQTWAHFGDAGRRVTAGRISNGVGERPRADFNIRASSQPVDYARELQVTAGAAGEQSQVRFTGFTMRAIPNLADQSVAVEALGATEMAESIMSATMMWGLSAQEQIYMVARSAGLPADRIVLEGFPENRRESFVIRAPISGLQVIQSQRVGLVHFAPVHDLRSTPPLAADFRAVGLDDAATMASTIVSASDLWEAEQFGVARISEMLDGLLVAGMYSWSAHPSGRLLEYSREENRARPSLTPYVYIAELNSGRGWVRATDMDRVATFVDLDRLVRNWPHLNLGRPSQILATAFRYLRTCADPSFSDVERVQALWNGLELYSTGVRLDPVIDDKSLKTLRRAVRTTGLNPTQLSRAQELLGNMNNPPLFRKLVQRALDDGLPLSDEEKATLRRTRDSRNDAAHGRLIGSSGYAPVDLDAAVAIFARQLMRRWILEGEPRDEPTEI